MARKRSLPGDAKPDTPPPAVGTYTIPPPPVVTATPAIDAIAKELQAARERKEKRWFRATAQTQGLECPDCHCIASDVLHTFQKKQYVRRERRCMSCRRIFHTSEKIDTSPPE